LIERSERNPSYSLRAFARSLGVSHTYLSLVMSGKRQVSPKRAAQFSQALRLDDQAAEMLVREATQAPEPGKRASAQDSSGTPSFFALELDRFKLLSQWYHIAILDLTLLDDFRPDPAWIAEHLDIPQAAVTSAIERLERLGMIKREGGTLRKSHAKLAVPTYHSDKAVREFHSQMIKKALLELESGAKGDFEARNITGTTIPVDPDLLPQAHKRILKFRRSLLKFLSSGKKTRLYQLNVQLFPLSKKGVPVV
jgi:uncharacterized protein (TIGR02147 family)